MARDAAAKVALDQVRTNWRWGRLLRNVALGALVGLSVLPFGGQTAKASTLDWFPITGTNYAGSSCSTVSARSRSLTLTAAYHPSTSWGEKITINFCYISTQWSYVKSIKHEFWVSNSKCVFANNLVYGNAFSGYSTLWDQRRYCASSGSNYAGGRTFAVGKWIGHGQTNDELAIELYGYSFYNSASPNMEWRGIYESIWYK